MAWTFVRSVGTTVTGTGTAVSLTVGASGAAINDIVVVGIAVTANVSPTSVTDTQGNTYARVGGAATVSTTIDTELWASKLSTALVSGNSITANFAASRTCSIGALEFAGGTTIVDVSAIGATAATDVPPPASITTTVANDLVVLITSCSASGTLDVPTPTNYTAGASKTSSVPSFYMSYSIIVGTATRTEGTAQWTVSTGDVATSNVALQLTASTPAVPSPKIALARRRVGFSRRGRSSNLPLTQQPTPPPAYRANPIRQKSRTSWTSRRRQPVVPLTQTAVTVTFVPQIARPVRRGVWSKARSRIQPVTPPTVTFVPEIARPMRLVRRRLWARSRIQPVTPAVTVSVVVPPYVPTPTRTSRRGPWTGRRQQPVLSNQSTAPVTITFVPSPARPTRRGLWVKARSQPVTPVTVTFVPQIQRPQRMARRVTSTKTRPQPGTPITFTVTVPPIARPTRRGLWVKDRPQPVLPNQSTAAIQAVFLPDIASSRRRVGFSRRGHLVTFTVTQTAAAAPAYVPAPSRATRRGRWTGRRQQPVTPQTQTAVVVSVVPAIARPVRRGLWARDRQQPVTPIVAAVAIPQVARPMRLVRRGLWTKARQQPATPATVTFTFTAPPVQGRRRFAWLRRRNLPAVPLTQVNVTVTGTGSGVTTITGPTLATTLIVAATSATFAATGLSTTTTGPTSTATLTGPTLTSTIP